MLCSIFFFIFFFFNDTAPTEIYTLSLHDALPILDVPAHRLGEVLEPAHERIGLIVERDEAEDRKSTRLNSSHLGISYAVFCLKKKKNQAAKSQQKKRHSTQDGRDDHAYDQVSQGR